MAYNDWLSISPKTGTGNGTVSAEISGHSGYSTRTKSVNVSATINGTTTSKSVTFTQAGTSIPGAGAIKLDGTAYNQETISAATLKGATAVQFEINNTNARDFQYFIELVTGTMDISLVNKILSTPSYTGTTITDVAAGTSVTLSSLTSTATQSPGKFRITYSMVPADLARKFGEHQTYSIKLKTTPGNYTNMSSKPLKVEYGVAILTGATSTTPVELTSVIVEFPASTSFDVTGEGSVGTSATTKSISITAPSDVTWNATISG